jgi:hypothetical protein
LNYSRYLQDPTLIFDMAEPSKATGSWTDAFPAPRTTAPILSREEALSDLSSPDLLIVDVRRTDYEGGTVRGSINLPAHSFYMNRGVLYDLCKRAGVKRVAFYCGKLSCNCRAVPRTEAVLVVTGCSALVA